MDRLSSKKKRLSLVASDYNISEANGFKPDFVNQCRKGTIQLINLLRPGECLFK